VIWIKLQSKFQVCIPCQLDSFRLSGIASKSAPKWPARTHRQILPMLAESVHSSFFLFEQGK
jgi:hypothetical protein